MGMAISSQDLAPHTPQRRRIRLLFFCGAMVMLAAMAQGRYIRLRTPGCCMLRPVQDSAVSDRWLDVSSAFRHNTPLDASIGPLQGFA